MKKIFITLFALSAAGLSFAQGKFSASVTNTGNVLTFKLRPDANVTTGFSTIEFFLRYPTSSPAFTYGTVTVNTAAFPGMAGNGTIGGGAVGSGAWEIEHNNPVYVLPGYNVDHFIYTAPAVVTTPAAYTGGTVYDVISVQLLGTPPNTVDFQFVSDDFEAVYYLAITDENGGDLRPASLSNYFFPTTSSIAGPSGSTIYYQELLNVPVPVKFAGFTANKKGADAVLTWAVENESSVTDRYEVLRSVNGRDFTKVATVAPKNNGLTANTYELTEANIAAIVRSSSGLVYYRIKQIDKDGASTMTEIRSIRLDGKGFGVSAYPNPVKSATKLTIDLDQATDIMITVSNTAGQQVKAIQVQGFKGTNFQDVDMAKLAGGNYIIKVQAGAEVKSLPVTKVN
jgi:hypothetical protein